jgi:8-oxo-dGTP pyrophosphatase MutT (NUDIX family)
MKKKFLFPSIFLIEKKFKKKQIYYYLKTPNISVMIAKIKNKYLVVSQKRIPINKTTYEFPGGIIDKGTSPKNSALNELFEETGYKCIGKPKKLLSIYPDPGRLDCKYFGFFSNELIKMNKPEKGIKLHLFTKKKILLLIKQNKFHNACHVANFFSHLNMI